MKFCPECGTKLDNDNFKFCPECGYKFGSDTTNSNQSKKSESKGFLGGFIKGIRDQIPDEYVDKIKDNEIVDDAVTHAKIIWHGPQTEKEKAYRERKDKEKEVKKQEKERKRQEAIELRRKYKAEYEKREAEKRAQKVDDNLNQEHNTPENTDEVVSEVNEVPEEPVVNEPAEDLKLIPQQIDTDKLKETSIAEIDYGNFDLSDLQESLIKSLPVITNPSEYEEDIINKYAEFNSEERKELLKDCWTVTKLADEHNINRQEVQKAILTDEFLEKDLIGVFKVNPNNVRSLKILYRKPLTETEQIQETEKPTEEPATVTSNNDAEDSFTNEESIEEIKEIPEEPVVNEPVEEEVKSSQEKTNNVSTKVAQDNKKENNKKKEKKGIGRKIMDFNLGKPIMDKGKVMLEEEKRDVIEKISPLLPEYAKMLNTTPDNLYVTYLADTYMFRGTKHTSWDKNLVVMSIEDTKISYIVFGKFVGNRRTFFDTADIYSISFKNITSITDKVLNIELKMSGDNSINIRSEDYFGKKFLSELLEKYNNFNNGSDVTDNNASHNDTSNTDELLKYADLYKQGLLSEEEFEAKKKELL